MDKKRKLLFAGSESPTPWYLWGGIPPSTSYTIYDPINATSQANSYINLANPGTRDAAPGVAPTWANGSGWTFNGTTQYLNSSIIVDAPHTSIVWLEGGGGVYCFGAFAITPTRKYYIRQDNGSGQLSWQYGNGGASVTPSGLANIVAIISNGKGYRNGYVEANPISTWPGGAMTGVPMYMGCINQAGTPVSFYSGRILRFAHYNISLTDAQILSVVNGMLSYDSVIISDYQSVVSNLSPFCYTPLNETKRGIFFDVSSNDYKATIYGAAGYTLGASGNHGTALAFNNTNSDFALYNSPRLNYANIKFDEFSCSMWVNPYADSGVNVKLMNGWHNNITEYFAMELRSGNTIGLFLKENGITQNQGGVGTAPYNTWTHLVCYNSKSSGKFGVYINGVKNEFSRTLTGFTGPISLGYPTTGGGFNGAVQHIAYFDHALSQSEVNTLYV